MDTSSVSQRDWSRFDADDKQDRELIRLEILAESRRPAYSPAMVRKVGALALRIMNHRGAAPELTQAYKAAVEIVGV